VGSWRWIGSAAGSDGARESKLMTTCHQFLGNSCPSPR
jgi:hypothetical protein